MFYPVESLKRGGRFYLCWVADSWPLRFATITHRQLWSQDIRKICDDLIEVMNNESGRPTNRFSLRLSSQLMRGLARLYQKKVNVFLSELCMLNANVTKHANRKYNIPEVSEVHRTSRPRHQVPEQLPRITLPEEPESEQRIEEIIQSSGNVVRNIQEITLKEATIPEFQPPIDGFGEENPEQALQLLADRTIEQMMVPRESGHHSGLEAALDMTDKSHDSRLDKSRLVHERQMELIVEHEVSMFLKPNGEEVIPGGDFEKEIQIPEFSDIPIPEIPIPIQKQLPVEPECVEREPTRRQPAIQEPEEIELEELEETEPQAKRRRFRKLIIDKKTKISANTLRARINNPYVELRCEDSSDDIIQIRVPSEVFMRRPCHAGSSIHSNLSLEITRLFMRNLGVVYRSPRAEREFQEDIMYRPRVSRTISILERIQEVEEPIPERPQLQAEANIIPPENITHPEISLVQDISFSKDKFPQIEVQREDLAEMLTQKIETLSEQARKRKTTCEIVLTPKRQRSIGYVAFRESQKNLQPAQKIAVVERENVFVFQKEADKENVPENLQDLPENLQARPSKEPEKSVTAMLQEAGLADIQTYQPEAEPVMAQPKSSRRPGSENSETPLGSLDRTKVSLGDSDQTTDSKRFIRDQWGTEGTMVKILKFIKEGSKPVTVWSLVSKGPVISGYKSIIAARCFTSILKLKQHGFIAIRKCPETLGIQDIMLGSKFD